MHNLNYWLFEQDMPPGAAPAGNPVPAQSQAPDAAPPLGNNPMQVPGADDKQPEKPMPDVTNDPQAPDMPEHDDEKDFEQWKTSFLKLAVRGDVPQMLESIGEVRDQLLDAKQRKFVEDNIQVLLLRQDANLDKASREVRKLIKQELDRNNPATTVMQHITNTLDAYPLLNNILIKLAGLYAIKGDLHRKFIGSLTGSVQVGGAGNKEDLIYADSEYTINFSTRFYTNFGEITIGGWSLQEDDPDKFLSEAEVTRLTEGSPEERQVLRNRVVLESIAAKFANRSFLMHIVDPATGQIYAMGWDVAEGLRDGYKSGKLVVRQKKSEFRDAMITDNGEIVPLTDITVLYSKQDEELNSRGIAGKQEIPFMERRHGKLYLTASLDTLQELSSGMGGMFMKEIPYQGNPSDLPRLMRCVPSTVETLMRRC